LNRAGTYTPLYAPFEEIDGWADGWVVGKSALAKGKQLSGTVVWGAA